jgi:hypothetical protein
VDWSWHTTQSVAGDTTWLISLFVCVCVCGWVCVFNPHELYSEVRIPIKRIWAIYVRQKLS